MGMGEVLQQARIELRQNQQLIRLIEELEEQIDNLHFVNIVLGSEDDLEVVALHPETSTGIRLRLSMVQNNFHLFTRSWDLSFCVPVHNALTPQAELVEVLSCEQVKAWTEKIVEQWKKAR
ncbi:hypothetical protein [Brevibacillus agri]|uniref:hypothetical protein n=1 Tax=Brevibacillus agri TaxID=51101 RepID=UPI003D21F312